MTLHTDNSIPSDIWPLLNQFSAGVETLAFRTPVKSEKQIAHVRHLVEAIKAEVGRIIEATDDSLHSLRDTQADTEEWGALAENMLDRLEMDIQAYQYELSKWNLMDSLPSQSDQALLQDMSDLGFIAQGVTKKLMKHLAQREIELACLMADVQRDKASPAFSNADELFDYLDRHGRSDEAR